MLLKAMDDTDSSDSNISSSSNMTTAASFLSVKPKPFSQGQLNDLVCDLDLSKKSSEILAFCLKLFSQGQLNDLVCDLGLSKKSSGNSCWSSANNQKHKSKSTIFAVWKSHTESCRCSCRRMITIKQQIFCYFKKIVFFFCCLSS